MFIMHVVRVMMKMIRFRGEDFMIKVYRISGTSFLVSCREILSLNFRLSNSKFLTLYASLNLLLNIMDSLFLIYLFHLYVLKVCTLHIHFINLAT